MLEFSNKLKRRHRELRVTWEPWVVFVGFITLALSLWWLFKHSY